MLSGILIGLVPDNRKVARFASDPRRSGFLAWTPWTSGFQTDTDRPSVRLESLTYLAHYPKIGQVHVKPPSSRCQAPEGAPSPMRGGYGRGTSGWRQSGRPLAPGPP